MIYLLLDRYIFFQFLLIILFSFCWNFIYYLIIWLKSFFNISIFIHLLFLFYRYRWYFHYIFRSLQQRRQITIRFIKLILIFHLLLNNLRNHTLFNSSSRCHRTIFLDCFSNHITTIFDINCLIFFLQLIK